MNSIENFSNTSNFFFIAKLSLACVYSAIILLALYIIFKRLKLFYIKEVTLIFYLIIVCAICKPYVVDLIIVLPLYDSVNLPVKCLLTNGQLIGFLTIGLTMQHIFIDVQKNLIFNSSKKTQLFISFTRIANYSGFLMFLIMIFLIPAIYYYSRNFFEDFILILYICEAFAFSCCYLTTLVCIYFIFKPLSQFFSSLTIKLIKRKVFCALIFSTVNYITAIIIKFIFPESQGYK